MSPSQIRAIIPLKNYNKVSIVINPKDKDKYFKFKQESYFFQAADQVFLHQTVKV